MGEGSVFIRDCVSVHRGVPTFQSIGRVPTFLLMRGGNYLSANWGGVPTFQSIGRRVPTFQSIGRRVPTFQLTGGGYLP